jgi:hypothetical protein
MTPVPESSKVSASEWDSMSETERDSLLAREEAALLLAVEHYRALVLPKSLLKAKLDKMGDVYLTRLAEGHAALWSHRAF